MVWKTILSVWDGRFSGAFAVSFRVRVIFGESVDGWVCEISLHYFSVGSKKKNYKVLQGVMTNQQEHGISTSG